MQALRKFTSSTAAAASAMVSSRTDDLSRQQGRSGAATGFSNVRRRLYEQALQGAGRSTGSEDTEWAHRRASLAATERQLASLLGFVGKHQSAARTLSGACADLGGELRALYEAGGAGAADAGTTGTGGAAVGTVAAALVGVDEGARRELDAALAERVAGPLRAHATAIEALKPAMRERELTKVDYDARLRKVRELREKGGGDPSRLNKKEAKLAATRAALEEQTARLYEAFEALDGGRFAVVGPALDAFVEANRGFFGSGARALTGLPALSTAAPAATTGVALPPRGAGGGGVAMGAPPGTGSGGYGVGGNGGSPPSRVSGGVGKAQPPVVASPTTTTTSQFAGLSMGGGGGGARQSTPVGVVTAAEPRQSLPRPPSYPGAVGGASAPQQQLPPPPPAYRYPSLGGSGAGNPFGGPPAAAVAAGVLHATTTVTSGVAPPAFGSGAAAGAADRVVVQHAYVPQGPDELPLVPGDVIAVTTRHDDGWAVGTNVATGRSGAFPLNFTARA